MKKVSIKNMSSLATIKAKALRDPGVRKAYDDLELEFSIIGQVLDKRLKKGLSQKDLAERMGTKQTAISRFESGTYNPSLLFLKKLAKALGGKLEVKM